MKILHVDEQRGWRGGEQQASWLIQGLHARGHKVALAGRPGEAFLERDHGDAIVDRFALPFRAEVDFVSAWKLSRIVRQHQIDILHAHSSHAHIFACLARKFAGKGKVVVSRRVSFPPKANPFNRWKYRQPDRFLSVSAEVDRVLRAYGLDEKQLSVVHSSVDMKRLEVPPLSREELNVPTKVPLLVSAGALVGHKDHATLLQALSIVRRTLPDVHLVIAGEGDLRPSLERLIDEHNLGSVVRLLGHRDDAPRVIRAGDVYVSSSWSEGLGTSVLEALACETPVVATVAGGVPEMVLDGKTGYLVKNRAPDALAHAIVSSLENRANAKEMAVAGKKLVQEKFGVEKMIEGTIRVYEELLNGANQQ